MYKQRIFFLIGLLFFQLSCAVPEKIVREPSKPSKPNWIEKPVQQIEKLYFVGIYSNADTLEEGEEGAYKDALEKISSYLGIRIESTYSSFISEEERDISQNISSKTSSLVKSAKVEDSYYEKLIKTKNNVYIETYDIYVLVSFLKKEVANELKRQKDENKAKVKLALDSLLKGAAKEKIKDFYAARTFYTQGIELIGDVEGLLELENGSVVNSNELKLKLELALEEINIKLTKVSLSVNFRGTEKAKQLFNSHLASTLYDYGFTVTDKTAAIKIIGDVTLSKGSTVMNGYAYACYANGSLSAKRTSDGHVVGVYPLKVKGVHRTKEQAAMSALENAGIEAGKAFAGFFLETKSDEDNEQK